MAPLPKVFKFAFGVRYRPSWKIRDNIGSVVDSILSWKNGRFNADLFPASQPLSTRHTLLNEKDDTVTVSERDAVLSMTPQSAAMQEVISWGENFHEQVLGSLRKVATFEHVGRFGMLVE